MLLELSESDNSSFNDWIIMPFSLSDSFLTSPLLHQVLLLLNLVLAVLTILLLLFMPLHKLSVERRARRHRKLFDAYGNALRGLGSTEYTLEPSSVPLEYEAFADSAADVMREIGGNLAIRNFIGSQNVVVAYYTSLLTSRSWVKRFSAAERLGGLQLPHLMPVFVAALKREKDVRVISRLVWGISLLADSDSVAVINTILADPHFMSSKFSEFIYCNILRAFKQRNQGHELVALLGMLLNAQEIPVMLKRDIIQACGNEGLDDAESLIVEAFERFHDVPEMRIAIIRTINRLRLATGNQMLISCLQDEDWRIRGVAAKNLQATSYKIFSLLEKLLHDDNYLVRYNSALSLADAGVLGIDILKLEAQGDDRFAREIAGYVLKGCVRI
ncbi:MAG: HEAT repeat domain-containing protein [Oryzomonas sp.]